MALTEKNYWVPATPRRVEPGMRKPRGFTGKRNDRYYYRGRLWLGPSKSVGFGKRFALVETHEGSSKFGLAPIEGESK